MKNASIKKITKKKIIFFLIILFLSVGAAYFTGFFRQPDEFKASVIDLGLGFTAKNFCSCLFVVGQSEEFCRDYASVQQVQPRLSVDHANKKTESQLFFIFKQEAQYFGEDKGCALL